MGEGGLLAEAGWSPQCNVAAHLVWDGFNKILVRGTGMNHGDFPRMLLIILRPRIYKQQSRPPLRGSGEQES